MPLLYTVISSTRPGRAGLPIGNWFHGFAQKHGKFETKLVDLAEVNLPLLDEPHHPRLAQYTKDHTKAWSALISAADAFVFIIPEYNYSMPPALLNALDYLHREWFYKPAGFVSYGGPVGGARSVVMTKQTVTALKMMPMFEGIYVSLFSQFIKDGVFHANEHHENAGKAMLDELFRWTEAMKVLRG